MTNALVIFAFVALACFPASAHAQAVFAHFMLQNSYSYDQSDWTSDISTALDTGIEGFALNIAQRDYEVDRLADAYAVAESHNFKFFYSFDMGYSWQANDIIDIIAMHADSPSSYNYKGHGLLVSTFTPQQDNYGNSFWANIKSTLAGRGINIVFAPALIGYRDPGQASNMLSAYPSVDGFFNWWSWPADVNANLTTDTDIAYKNAVSSKTGPYIMSLSPWQFKNLGGDQDWVELSDTLWNYRWLQAINNVKPDIVEIVTWNDYAESHYIGDINPKVDLGDLAPQYVNGFPHSAWRTVAKYFIQWYKSGSQPTASADNIVFWYRVFPKSVTCSSGTRPRNADFPVDAIFAMAVLTSPATISLDIGNNNHRQWDAPAGVSIGSVPFPKENTQIPYFQIIRNGSPTKTGYGSYNINQSGCSYYNFNPFVGQI